MKLILILAALIFANTTVVSELPVQEIESEEVIYTPFTQQDFKDMETVDSAIYAAMESDEFLKLTPEQRAEVIIDLLEEFVAQGLVAENSIQYDKNSKAISYKYPCGIMVVIELEEHKHDAEYTITRQDFESMRVVQTAIKNVLVSDEYLKLPPGQLAEVIIDMLEEFVNQGLIIKDSIQHNESTYTILFRHSCGVPAVVNVMERTSRVILQN